MEDKKVSAQHFIRDYLTRFPQTSPPFLPENLDVEILSIAEDLSRKHEIQTQLHEELTMVLREAFPSMEEQDFQKTLSWYFQSPGEQFRRHAILIRHKASRLIAMTLFDYGNVEYGPGWGHGVYVINCTVVPQYQGNRLGQAMAAVIFARWSPDILLITCSQSPSLHSWIGLSEKGILDQYDVYPQLKQEDDKMVLVTVPYQDIGHIVTTFRQLYLGIVQGNVEDVEQKIKNFTLYLVRKNCYGILYEYHPWKNRTRPDLLAEALGVEKHDGVLVVFKKRGIPFPKDTFSNEHDVKI